MSFAVRPATISDIDWLTGQLKKFSEFNNSKISLFDGPEEFKFNFLKNLIENHVVLICDKQTDDIGEDGEFKWLPVGLIGGSIQRHFMNPNIKVLTEYFWWVDEAYRSSRAGYELFMAFDEMGEEMCDWVTFSLLDNTPGRESLKSFLEKKGYKLSELAFLKENIKVVQNG
jgi:hypothetical protein